MAHQCLIEEINVINSLANDGYGVPKDNVHVTEALGGSPEAKGQQGNL